MSAGIMPVAAGGPAVRLLSLAYRANLPVLLHGRHGVGKSELLQAAARELGVQVIVRDLSLMEPPDLVGIPHVEPDGRTHYAPPAFLPTEGRGLLVFEELNRAPRFMSAPCLQLLTARSLNDYRLPPGWLPCAAVNDGDDGYLVDDLDAALLSRFVRARVEPSVAHWCDWAGGNRVHPRVLAFVRDNPNIFTDPQSNPRSWTYVSQVLHAMDAEGEAFTADELVVAVAGLVGETWAGAFVSYVGADKPLSAAMIAQAYASHRGVARRWREECRLDLLEASWANLRNHLQRQANFEGVVADPRMKKNVEVFLGDLTPDLLAQARAWLHERGLTGLSVPRKTAA
jgi:hypothetical protein